jgi:hypothetical protein
MDIWLPELLLQIIQKEEIMNPEEKQKLKQVYKKIEYLYYKSNVAKIF